MSKTIPIWEITKILKPVLIWRRATKTLQSYPNCGGGDFIIKPNFEYNKIFIINSNFSWVPKFYNQFQFGV